MGMYILNKDDDFQTHQYTFSGLNDIYESFMLDVAGAAEIPVTKLFGRSPAGFNATGESDSKNYYETIEQKQTSKLEPVLDKLLPIMFMSEFGAIPDDLDYIFNPIATPSDDDLASIVDKKANTIINAFNAGLISQKVGMKELRQMSDSTGMFTNITDEDIDNADDSTDAIGDMPIGNEVTPYDSEEEYGQGFMDAEKTNRDNLQKKHKKINEEAGEDTNWFDRLKEHIKNN
jgi:hypothetical protein